jgi:hypothetical protein
VGYAAARTASSGGPVLTPGEASAASVLQGLIGLLLDDWRSALLGVRVQFILSRVWPASAGPADANQLIVQPGARWKANAEEGGRLPPAGACSLLFRRHSAADLCLGRPAWPALSPPHGGPQWWCGAATTADLMDMGFTYWEPDEDSPVVWEGPPGSIPPPITCLLGIGPPDEAQVYRVVRDHARTVLRPEPTSHAAMEDEQGFEAFRLAALDAVLNALLDPIPLSSAGLRA